MSAQIALYCQEDNARVRYISRQILEDWLGLKIIRCDSREELARAPFPRLQYGGPNKGKELYLPMHAYMEGRQVSPEIARENGHPVLFPVAPPVPGWSFDLFAMTFYLLSREEEYQEEAPRDKLGRFLAETSLAAREGFLQRPMLDHWVEQLRQQLVDRYPDLPLPAPTYRFTPTYDIDYFWAYRQRPLWHVAGGMFKALFRGNWRQLQRRRRVITGRAPDPFFTFQQLHDWHEQYGLSPRYFVLVSDFRGLDRPNSWKRPAVQEAVHALHRQALVGLHPSVASNQHPGKLQEEKQRLEKLLGEEVVHSRQHYLCLRFPDTYRSLLQAGFLHDYSMGYHDRPGFRASTSRSFRWYDLEREEETDLRIHPFGLMDVSLKRHLGLSPEAGLGKAREIIGAARRSGGELNTLWHNSSFYELEGWGGWKEVYEKILQEANH